ncbi:chemotaxis protein MotB [Thiosulfatimonas sediminis]|uniref:Chemotaxis protein MotB n=1 Tax=Thiosulfatimonas sediminis TaxID=2675054 RepID=A0A6F8PSH5_9GAMM|nr:flagellar motor protein MotB [Thiosulfatimonas sediminis]BBP44984.1 chemotaxis protein MotB [Thiosulfatimonas sediminis]
MISRWLVTSPDKRARSGWLLAFGDVITLLITFFIMMIVLNKTQVSKLQVWADEQVNSAYLELEQQIDNQGLQVVSVHRTPQGILFKVQSAAAFDRAGYTPSAQLQEELQYLGVLLKQSRLFRLADQDSPQTRVILEYAAQQDLYWNAEIVIEGHTDSDSILPNSPLQNNWFLSAMRAQTVMDQLFQASELPPQQFSISGFAEHHPVQSNETAAGKERNRRIEILLTAGFVTRLPDEVATVVAPVPEAAAN